MKNKKVLVILIAIVFFVIAIISFVALFSIKRVHVDFAVHKETDSKEIQDSLDAFLGDNLLFLNLDKVDEVLDDYHYIEVVSVKKSFPNVLDVKLKERREIFYIKNGTSFIVTNEDGFVLNSVDCGDVLDNISRDKIIVDLTGVNIIDHSLGDYLKTDNDALVNSIFEMAKSVNLTDNINEISVFTADGAEPDVKFNIVTGATIIVQKVDVNNQTENQGKIKNAFFVYDTLLSDFEKFTGEILSTKVNNPNDKYHGCFRVLYNGQERWTSDK